LEVSPSKRQVNIAISSQSVISGVILVLFWYCFEYIIASLSFLAKIFMFCILFYIWNTTREKFEEKIENLKKSSTKKIDSMVEYTYDDIDNWLVEYTNKNEDIIY
jgi:hypothetical protein